MDITEKLVTTTEAMANLCSAPMDLWNEHSNAALKAAATITALRKRVEELEEALKPFAKAGGVKLCGEWRDDERFGHTDVTFYLTFGDLRRARSLLSRKGGE